MQHTSSPAQARREGRRASAIAILVILRTSSFSRYKGGKPMWHAYLYIDIHFKMKMAFFHITNSD